ncbi:MAG: UDP-N-acetylmuramate dehydrogenase [bacterium]
MKWWKPLKGKVKIKEKLCRHTTLKVGGAADFFVYPKDAADLKLLLNLLKRGKMPFLLIGAGSKILASDKGFRGVVISLDSPYFKEIRCRGNYLEAGGAVKLGKLLSVARKHGLSGAEFLAGIPATIGGALAMNAGISQRTKDAKIKTRDISQLVTEVTVMDYNGDIKRLKRKEINFGYRRGSLSKYIILSASLRLRKKDRERIAESMKEYLDYRKRTQDPSWLSAGCVFKNPKGYSAGRLIDLCSLKGKKIGGAGISIRHANIIINTGGAKAGDILRLMVLISEKVRLKFNIELEPEIKIWQN